LIRDGQISRGYVGVAGQSVPLHRRVVRFYDLPAETGVLVASVEKGSPAEKAGVREGDVIVAYGAQPVGGVEDLHRILTDEQIDVAAEITLIRLAERLTLRITPVQA